MRVLKNLFHVSLQVNDFDKMVEFYSNKLGFELMFKLTIGDFKDMLKQGQPADNDSDPWLCYMRVAPEEYIEMFSGQIIPPEFKKEKIVNRADAPFDHFAIEVKDLKIAAKEFEKKGILFTFNSTEKGEIFEQSGYFIDPEGNKIIVVEKSHNSALAYISIYVNDIKTSILFYEKLGFKVVKVKQQEATLSVVDGQYLILKETGKKVNQYTDTPLAHFALQVESLEYTAREWDKQGLSMCYHPFQADYLIPLDPFECSIGLDFCMIAWILDPDGNKIEVMEQPGNTMQQIWEKANPFDNNNNRG